MATDIYLRSVPSDTNPHDLRLYDPTVADAGGVQSGVGSSAGVATVSGVGASVAAAVGSTSGVATVNGVGNALIPAEGGASGIATVSGVGASIFAGVAASSGLAAVNGIGAAIAAGVFAATGKATVSGVGSFTGSATPDEIRSKGGWDPYYYKRRKKRKKDKAELETYLAETAGPVPAPIRDEVADARSAAIRALEAEGPTLLGDALRAINRADAAARLAAKQAALADEEEDEEILLLWS